MSLVAATSYVSQFSRQIINAEPIKLKSAEAVCFSIVVAWAPDLGALTKYCARQKAGRRRSVSWAALKTVSLKPFGRMHWGPASVQERGRREDTESRCGHMGPHGKWQAPIGTLLRGTSTG